MKKSKALARTAQAQSAQADRLAKLERNIALIMEHLGITPPPDPLPETQGGGIDTVSMDGDGQSEETQVPETDVPLPVPTDGEVESPGKRKK